MDGPADREALFSSSLFFSPHSSSLPLSPGRLLASSSRRLASSPGVQRRYQFDMADWIGVQRRYGCRAMMLETVVAVPRMVGGMLLHLRSLRRFEHNGGWIRALLEEAENERMHLEEEAIHSYIEFLADIEAGKIENVPAPRIAIAYWRLPPDTRLKDVVIVVRANEAHHRDVNHFALDIHFQGVELNKTPAPLGYH